MIMPAVFAFGLDPTAGPGLTFMTMPVVFAQLPFGQFSADCVLPRLVLAAITSSVSLLELVVAFVVDELKLKRIHAVSDRHSNHACRRELLRPLFRAFGRFQDRGAYHLRQL